MRVEDLDTPAAIVELDIMQDNIQRMHKHLKEHGLRIRPHIKTHKIPAIAHMQLKAGAKGINCQKLGEAEVMVNAGIKDILITYNIVGKQKLDRLIRLTKQATVVVVIDSGYVAQGISEAAVDGGSSVGLLVELDVGGRRTGVQTPEAALELAKKIVQLPGVDFKGLMAYKGGMPDPNYIDYASAFTKEALRLLAEAGIPAEEVSCAGTVYAWGDRHVYGATEWRPGLYVYNDLAKVAAGVATLEQCAMRVITTVVARPTSTRVVIDAGSKILSIYGPPTVQSFGYVVEYPEAFIYSLSEEHGKIEMSVCSKRPKIGERLTIIPNWVNAVTNLVDEVYGVRDGRVEAIWPVLARGKVR